MGMGKALVNKLKRRRKALNKNRGLRTQDKIDLKDEKLAKSPRAYSLMTSIQRRQDNSFGQQLQPSFEAKVGKELLRLADIQALSNESGDDIAAVAAFYEGQVAGMTTDIRIEADTAGAAGNLISLVFDGLSDIDATIAAWNLANPSDTVTLISGDGSQIPDLNETMDLAGGSDIVVVDDTLELTFASGTLRAAKVQVGDIVTMLSGDLVGQQLKITSVDYSTDVLETELIGTLSAPENSVPVKLQISGVKKSYK